jgi:hypothetical protein
MAGSGTAGVKRKMTQISWQMALPTNSTLPQVIALINTILQTRERDIQDYLNLPEQFIGGRKVDKIPTSSADYDPTTDLVGDRNWDTNYEYMLVADGVGGSVWRRITLASW